MSEPSRGYQTLASGSPRYLEMAVDMALSLRQHTTHPVALAADEAIAELTRTRYAGVFDEVGLIPEAFRDGRGLKYGVAEASPYQETMYVDSDCIVLGSLDSAWRALDDADVAMLGELLTEDEDKNHHGFSTRKLMRRFGLDRYLKTNSGLFAYRRDPAIPIMRECLDCYLNEVRPRLRWSILRGAWLGDEIALGIVGGRRRLGTLPAPAAMYWPQEFERLDLDAPAKPLLHFIWPIEESTFERLMREAMARREAAGVPVSGTDHWRHEQEKLKKMARRRRLAERFGLWG